MIRYEISLGTFGIKGKYACYSLVLYGARNGKVLGLLFIVYGDVSKIGEVTSKVL